jgi:hypothetical protein
MKTIRKLAAKTLRVTKRWWRASLYHRFLTILIAIVLLIGGVMYSIGEWYLHSQAGKPYQIGVTFIPDYASALGLKPEKTMDALTNIGIQNFRLVSYWSDLEVAPGRYDFSQLDWQFKKVNEVHGTVSLAIGLRQPRWPECHMPSWIDTKQPRQQWQPQLEQFMSAVIKRYRYNPALVSYQLENEYFNHFGECYNFDRQRLSDELNLVRKYDSWHPVIISRSNNYVGLMLKQPLPDEIGISVYRRVWDAQVSHRYFQYPYPSWYYAFLAGAEKIVTGKDSVLHELQAEPWPPNGQTIQQISLAEQNKSFDAARFQKLFEFARNTGMRQVYFWGGEYWYYRMTVLHDPSVWNVAKQEFSNQ